MKDKWFPLGRVVATPGALELLPKYVEKGITVLTLLKRHASGDDGDLCPEDKAANIDALKHGGRIFSSYKLSEEDKIWVITEADRSSTCFLLPSEY